MAKLFVDVIDNGKLTVDALKAHLKLTHIQLVQLGLCHIPRPDYFNEDVYTISHYIPMPEVELANFVRHALDGNFGNVGDGEAPYFDNLEPDYKGSTVYPRD